MKENEIYQDGRGAIIMRIGNRTVELTLEQVRFSIDVNSVNGYEEVLFCKYYNVACSIPENLDELVASECKTTLKEMYSGSKKRSTGAVQARQLFMRLLHDNTKYTFQKIGSKLKTELSPNGMTHSNVMHACEAVQNDIDTCREYREIYERITKKIKENKVLIP